MTRYDTLTDSIEAQLEGHHDTLYCKERHESMLARQSAAPGMSPSSIDNLRFMGLDVETLPGIKFPIVCQKGEVFPLAKDYKNE